MNLRIVYRLILPLLPVALFVLSVGCSGKAEPQLEVWKEGGFQPSAINTYKVAGKRDGAVTRVSASFTLESGEILQMDLDISYDPQPVLSSALWTVDGYQPGSSDVIAESLKFLGGQGEGPSLGGRFRLEQNGAPRYRVVLPLRPVNQSEWTVN